MRVQAFVAQPAVEGLYERVVRPLVDTAGMVAVNPMNEPAARDWRMD
jgi:hypothetical protein